MNRENKYIQSIFSDNLAFKPGMNVNIYYIPIFNDRSIGELSLRIIILTDKRTYGR